MPDNFLEHYGMKGMKWGIRKKYKESKNTRITRFAKEARTDAATTRKIAEGMDAEVSSGKQRSSKQLKAEAKSLRDVAKRSDMLSDEYKLKDIAKRSEKEANKPEQRRTVNQLKKDSAYLKQYADWNDEDAADWDSRLSQSIEVDPDDILHFGVKGMRWGVRKDRGSGGRKSSAKTAKTLTDKELKKRVARLNMEKQYVQLSEGSKSKGKKLVTNMIKTAGKQKMQSLVTKGVSDVVDYGLAAGVAAVKARGPRR